MYNIIFLYPKGLTKAVTMSYDDGQIFDRRLVEIFNRRKIRSAFNLSCRLIGRNGFVAKEEIPELYQGHEIACHAGFHAPFSWQPPAQIQTSLLSDRHFFEDLLQRPVLGVAYPGGRGSAENARQMRSLGFLYARTCVPHHGWGLPDDFFLWDISHRHDSDLAEKASLYIRLSSYAPSLFFLAGHSYEFEQDQNWEWIERICEILGNHEDIWYPTPVEIAVWRNTIQSLRFSTDFSSVWNPTCFSVWYKNEHGSKIFEIRPGETAKIMEE